MISTLFVLCVFVSILILFQTFYVYLREVGLLAFLPGSVQRLLTQISFFDILVSIFIYKRFSKLMLAIFSSFWEAKTPEEARKLLRKQANISPQVQKIIFRKVISIAVNACPGYHEQPAKVCKGIYAARHKNPTA